MSQPGANSRYWSSRNLAWIILIFLALAYALLAGLRTVADFDLGWQLATGRYVVQHHTIPRTEMFSYTAFGTEWIYPLLSGVMFYLLFLAKGYAALSWLNALAAMATVGFLLTTGKRVTAVLAILAVPAIAFRTTPRAELFTTVFFAALLALIWRHYQGKSSHLWLLPILFALWANLHLGFVAGLGLLGAYIFLALCDAAFGERRAIALQRLRQAAPWLAASFAALLLNPWGWRIFSAIRRQQDVTKLHSAFIGEWSAMQFNALSWQQFISPRDPASGDWWMLFIAGAAMLICLWRKRPGPAVLLSLAMYFSVEHIRFQALFAMLVVAIGGNIFPELKEEAGVGNTSGEETAEQISRISVRRVISSIPIALVLLALLLVGIRVNDLVTQRYYVETGQITMFGAGASWWFPERAADFILREKLPGNVFHDYTLGGYVTWKLGPRYGDFVDGRYMPFGEELFTEQRNLVSLAPDGPEWQAAEGRWNLNTILFPVSRYAGLGSFPLPDYCQSTKWKLVYLDDTGAVFLRNRPENAALLTKFARPCETAALAPPATATGDSYRARAERFTYLTNTASIYFLLARDAEADGALREAEALFPENPSLHLVKAQLLQANNHFEEAEREFVRALQSAPSDGGWFALAHLYAAEHRYAEAERCVKNAAALSQMAYDRWRSLGQLYLVMKEPQEALAAFDRAGRLSPYTGDASEFGAEFNAKLAEGRARSYRAMNDLPRAVAQQEIAVTLTPMNAARWFALGDLYEAAGEAAKAAGARSRGAALQKQQGGISAMSGSSAESKAR
jgi:tetratricopeptide (TPR) repeat protein